MSRLLFLATAIVLGTAMPAGAGDKGKDQYQARKAVESGEIHPLDQVLDVARKQLPGDVVKVELEHEDGRWVYEIKILNAKGERREVEIDATSLKVLEID